MPEVLDLAWKFVPHRQNGIASDVPERMHVPKTTGFAASPNWREAPTGSARTRLADKQPAGQGVKFAG